MAGAGRVVVVTRVTTWVAVDVSGGTVPGGTAPGPQPATVSRSRRAARLTGKSP